MEKIPLGIAGCGRNFERWHFYKALHSKIFLPYFVFDSAINLNDPLKSSLLKNSKDIIAKYNLEPTNSFEDMILNLKQVGGAVVINSPDSCHYSQAMIAIKSKIPLLIEKPIVLTKDQCDSLKHAVENSGIIFMSSFPTPAYLREITLREIFSKFDSKSLEGCIIEAGYYHDFDKIFNDFNFGKKSFFAHQNYFLGGGSHALASVLRLTGESIIDVDPIKFKGKIFEDSPNPTAYCGKMTLSNGIKLSLEADVRPSNNFFKHGNIKERENCRVYFLLKDPNEKIILETRKNPNGEDVIYLDQNNEPEEIVLKKDNNAFDRIYREFGKSIKNNTAPSFNDIQFSHNVTFPLLDALNKSGIERYDLQN